MIKKQKNNQRGFIPFEKSRLERLKPCLVARRSQTGFIALISAIIISVVLLLVVTSAALTGFSGRFNILDSELKERSSAIADACVDEARLYLADGSIHTYPALEPVGTDKCYIDSVTDVSPNKVIAVHAVYNDFHTNLSVTVNPTNFSVVSWQECKDSSPC